jgi:hypothetical protein
VKSRVPQGSSVPMKAISIHTASSRTNLLRVLWSCLLLFIFSIPSSAQGTDDYTVQANIIYHFTKYIDWPADKKTGDFIIGVYGDSPLYDELQKSIANKTVGSQKIVIKKIFSPEGAKGCHILFISEEMSSSIKKVASQTASSSVLLVSEQEGLAKRGACINFVVVSDRLKLEINPTNIEQHDLSIASELLKLGKIVK